jgi:hypothetical protein
MADKDGVEWWNNQTPDYPKLKRKDRPSWKSLATGEEMRDEVRARHLSACQAHKLQQCLTLTLLHHLICTHYLTR